jgi:tRNA(fMet)-specific endonuclease VapC
MIIMLSSDLCRLVLRQQPRDLLSRLQTWSANGDEVVISAITYAELVAGVLLTEKQTAHMDLVTAFCERLEDVLPWNREAVDRYTAIQQRAMQAGHAINLNDAMVAAHALSVKATLLVVNDKPFRGIEGIQVETWSVA